MKRKTNDRRSVLMMVASMLIFGTIGVFRRYIPVSSPFLAFARGLTGGLFILLIWILRKKPGDRIPCKTMAGLILSGVMIGINWILLFEAYRYTTIAVATLCYYMQPTIVVLLSPLVFRERLTARKAVCAAVAVAGMVLVSGVAGGGPAGDARGILLGLGAAVFYSGVVILNKSFGQVNELKKTAVQLLSAGLAMLPYLLVTGGFSAENLTPRSLVLLLVVGIMHTGIAYMLYFSSFSGLRVQSVALLSYIDPVFALLISALLLREPLTLLNLIGAVMIIGAAAVSEARSD